MASFISLLHDIVKIEKKDTEKHHQVKSWLKCYWVLKCYFQSGQGVVGMLIAFMKGKVLKYIPYKEMEHSETV